MGGRLFKVAKVLLVAFLVIVFVLVAFCCFERLRGAISLASYKRALAAQGEPLTARDLLGPTPAGTNGAPEIARASGELVKGDVLPDHYPPRMKLTPSGQAMVGFRQAQWTENNRVYDWEQLAEDLRANEAVLARIRSALASPVLDNQLDYAAGPKIRFPQLITAKSLTYWFGSSSELALHENRLQDCLDSLLAEIGLLRFLERDRIVISELVRVALGAIARADTWEALQAEGWTDEQLAHLQKAWEKQHFLKNFTRSLQGERIFATTTFDFCRASNKEAASSLFWMEELGDLKDPQRPAWENMVRGLPAGDDLAEFLKKQVYCRLWRFAWLDQCETRYLRSAQQLVEVSRAAEKSLSSHSAQTENDLVVAATENKNVYDAMRFPFGVSLIASLSRAVNRAMRAETERSLVLAAIALKRYQLQHRTPPASLDVLVPQFLAAVPIDYMDAKPIKFVLNADGTTVLYSVGEDGVDNHGDSQPDSKAHAPGIWARKDVVWPGPAAPESSEGEKAKR